MTGHRNDFRVTDGLTPQEAAELIGRLDRGYKAAYEKAHEAFPQDRDKYEALFTMATEVNELAADGIWETYEAGRPAGMSVEEWAARDTEWERQFEAAATAAKEQRLADERAADEEAHERALDEEIDRLAAEFPEVTGPEREQAEVDADARENWDPWAYPGYEGPGYTEPPVNWEGWHQDHAPGWTFEEWASERGYIPEAIEAASRDPGPDAAPPRLYLGPDGVCPRCRSDHDDAVCADGREWGPRPPELEADPDPTTPASAARETADQVIRAQADAGMRADAIERDQGDVAADMLSDAQTPDGQAFAREYSDTVGIYVRDLRELEQPQPNAPHPDPALAARGWRTCAHPGHGIYVRRPAEIELEAS
jgi:hypothetical protein